MCETYRTVTEVGESQFTVRGSRFIGRIEPARDKPTAESAIQRVREAHPEASHVVTAYRVRADPLREWSTDDGEPRGTAGAPVLNVLAGEQLENVVATVVRYFGGTELGTGGLARAYGAAVKEAVAATQVIDRAPRVDLTVTVGYDDSGRTRSILEAAELAFEADYAADATFRVTVPSHEAAAVRDQVLSVTSGRAALERSEQR